MDKVIKNKRGLELVTSYASGTKQVQKSFFISYILSNQIWWLISNGFLVIPKITSANLNLESVERKRKNKKIEHLENEKSLLDEILKNFIVFEGLLFGEKIKISSKIADTSFKNALSTATIFWFIIISI